MGINKQIIMSYGVTLDERLKQPLSVTIGNFDGLHRGHRILIDQVRADAREIGIKSAVLCFDPHPDDFFSKSTTRRIFTPEQRTRALCEVGVDVVMIQEFNHDFSQLTADEFISGFLMDGLQARSVVVGSDFRFGAGRKGDSALLKLRGLSKAMDVTVIEPLFENSHPIRSSVIRAEIAERGNIALANELLGHPFYLEAVVTKGRQIGRTIGFPTINFGEIRQIVPKKGVYFGWFVPSEMSGGGQNLSFLRPPDHAARCVINIGTRPSFGDSDHISVEAHIFDKTYPTNSFYGEHAAVYFGGRLRDEMKFASKEELIEAIAGDIRAAKKMFP
jgi:riboflavin kinase/FMN adenylyltransferase